MGRVHGDPLIVFVLPRVYALCDDGSIWEYGDDDHWFCWPDIPQEPFPDIPQDEPEQPATSPDVVDALFALDNAEQQHRFLADPGNGFSREHSFAAWKTTRDAIDKVRKVLKRIDEQEGQV